MAQNTAPAILKVALVVTIIIDGLYGLMFFLAPNWIFGLGGATPFDPGILRWSGGVLIALTVGTAWVLQSPAHQGVFVNTLLIAYLLAALAHTYTLVMGEYSGEAWLIVVPLIVVWIGTILLFLGRQAAQRLLQ